MSEMTDERAAEVLAAHNEWRRYDGDPFDPDAPRMDSSKLIGRAIDHAVSRLRSQPPAEAQPVAWPDGLLDRVKEAERRIENGHAPRRIPADPSDVDLVLAEVRALLEGCDPPFWIKPQSSPVGVEAVDAAEAWNEAQVWCPSCDGAGWTPDAMDGSAWAVCPDCAGSGRGEHSITVNEAQADWEAAPPGATHYHPHQGAYYKRVSASEWYVWSRENDRELMRWLPSPGTSDSAEWVVRPVESHPSAPVGVEE